MPASSSAPVSPAAFTVRPYREGDEGQILDLFEVTFGRPLSEAHYRWKVLTHEAPFESVWVATTGARIVGHYACTPLRFKLGDRLVWAAHVCDVMTAPDVRRQGVLTAVGTAVNAAWRRAEVAFTTGLPNERWGSRREHLGWQRQFEMRWVRRPLRLDRLVARQRPVAAPFALPLRGISAAFNGLARLAERGGAALRIREVTQAGPEFDELWGRLAPLHEALIVRDRAWVAYRYLAAPGLAYRVLVAERGGSLAGYVAFRSSSSGTGTMGLVADVFTAPRDSAAAALLHAAVTELRAADADQVRALVPARAPIATSFTRAGFLRAGGNFDASIVPLAAQGLEPLGNPGRWFTLGGDFDVV